MVQQAAVVDRQEPLERVGRRLDAGAPRSARATSVAAPSPTMRPMRVLGQRRAAARHEQRVGRVGEVAPRIDERAVEIEDDEAEL